ncbi:cytochrome C oxidase copper chaperone-domain-containing protein [Neohortaea acidophila]|uniref:Cytochrome C oxidase copper chaperone-domain-containing protein n=1 Tax=Neohortaea acidophila TaxID=245834 RepID=A0A6A6PL18_9PEZI|nr:cytochrome C oxidase copper chaperone-domain-containing protein [Neohortaea acidophila]KAF2480496.1 cytochrome C oxidase copper chaperone-domain-containing protein [Neohortaea acidophila]
MSMWEKVQLGVNNYGGFQTGELPGAGQRQMQPNNLAADVKAPNSSDKPKPCCVCKDEKQARDECMLFSTSADPQAACQDLVGKYRSCMAGFGFNLP